LAADAFLLFFLAIVCVLRRVERVWRKREQRELMKREGSRGPRAELGRVCRQHRVEDVK
jgi:hypothetical protein